MTGYDPETLAFYAQEAPIYAASGPKGTSRYLARFMAMVPPDGSILELGCGGGKDAAEMIAHGFAVEPTDGTPALAAEAAKLLGRAVRVMRFDELEAVEGYHGIWASASLLHVPRTSLSDILALIHRALHPGGIFAASFKGGDAEGRDRFGRYFNFPDREWLETSCQSAAQWKSLEVEESMGSGYDGVVTPWYVVWARKA